MRYHLSSWMAHAAKRKPCIAEDGTEIMAGENLIIRPVCRIPETAVTFVQLDDLKADQLERVRPASFLIFSTSPGNYQAWVAVSGYSGDTVDLCRSVRTALGAGDHAATGSTRIAGSENFKSKYAPEFPMVRIVHGVPGRVMKPEQLQGMGLLADPEPARAFAIGTDVCKNAPARVSPAKYDRPWPSYQITLSRTRARRDGSGPDRSLADFNWAMTCCTGGKSIEDTIAKLMEVSANAQERAARGDEGYARITVQNAAAAVARNFAGGKGRA
jgi:hypothetical protein